jgi:hypothetical protein
MLCQMLSRRTRPFAGPAALPYRLAKILMARLLQCERVHTQKTERTLESNRPRITRSNGEHVMPKHHDKTPSTAAPPRTAPLNWITDGDPK